MVRLFSPFQRARGPASQVPKARLAVEQLEDRFCPVAPMLSNLGAVHIGSSLVVSGRVLDESPGTVRVTLTGAVSPQVPPNSSGDLNSSWRWPGWPAATSQATDNESLTSGPLSATIAEPVNANPFITLSVSYGAQRTVTLSGRVVDEVPGGRTVALSGAASGMTTTDANGNFSIT